MAQENRFLDYVLIILFAAGMVLIGARELQKDYLRYTSTSTKEAVEQAKDLVLRLHGSDIKARVSPQALKESGRQVSPATEKDYGYVKAPPRSAKADALSDEDRSELKGLIGRILAGRGD